MITTAGAQVPPDFLRALQSLRGARVRPELHLEEVPPPTRVAPFSVALTGDLTRPGRPDEELSDGRFIALHDPAGQPDWGGTFRVVTLVRAEVEPEMSSDALLGQVAWSWVTEALATHAGDVDALGGTVTRVINESFGAMDTHPGTLEVEIRASWTPRSPDLSGHLLAWAALLGAAAGVPALPEGVASLDDRR